MLLCVVKMRFAALVTHAQWDETRLEEPCFLRGPRPRRVHCLPMALMPNPGVAPEFGPEVGTADVVDLRGEAQESAVAVGPVGARSRLGEAILLRGAVQQVEWTVLNVG